MYTYIYIHVFVVALVKTKQIYIEKYGPNRAQYSQYLQLDARSSAHSAGCSKICRIPAKEGAPFARFTPGVIKFQGTKISWVNFGEES